MELDSSEVVIGIPTPPQLPLPELELASIFEPFKKELEVTENQLWLPGFFTTLSAQTKLSAAITDVASVERLFSSNNSNIACLNFYDTTQDAFERLSILLKTFTEIALDIVSLGFINCRTLGSKDFIGMLNQFPNLEALSLCGCPKLFDDVKFLKSNLALLTICPSLRRLELKSLKGSVYSIILLVSMLPHLQSLHISNCHVKLYDIPSVWQKFKLRELEVDQEGLEGNILSKYLKYDQVHLVKTLSFNEVELSTQDESILLELFPKFMSLESVVIVGVLFLTQELVDQYKKEFESKRIKNLKFIQSSKSTEKMDPYFHQLMSCCLTDSITDFRVIGGEVTFTEYIQERFQGTNMELQILQIRGAKTCKWDLFEHIEFKNLVELDLTGFCKWRPSVEEFSYIYKFETLKVLLLEDLIIDDLHVLSVANYDDEEDPDDSMEEEFSTPCGRSIANLQGT